MDSDSQGGGGGMYFVILHFRSDKEILDATYLAVGYRTVPIEKTKDEKPCCSQYSSASHGEMTLVAYFFSFPVW